MVKLLFLKLFYNLINRSEVYYESYKGYLLRLVSMIVKLETLDYY